MQINAGKTPKSQWTGIFLITVQNLTFRYWIELEDILHNVNVILFYNVFFFNVTWELLCAKTLLFWQAKVQTQTHRLAFKWVCYMKEFHPSKTHKSITLHWNKLKMWFMLTTLWQKVWQEMLMSISALISGRKYKSDAHQPLKNSYFLSKLSAMADRQSCFSFFCTV